MKKTDNFNNINLNCLNSFLNSNKKGRLVLNGIIAPFNIFTINSILKNNKKIIYITQDEQSALKIQKDLTTLLNIESRVFPSQDISFYTQLEKNYYIYQEQLNIILSQPDVILMNTKALFEKFAPKEFYLKNAIKLKKDDTIDYSKIAQTLISYGYKRTTNVSDIGEFALRGDILDIYSLDNNPVRIEFFADTIEDIRYFDPNTQKSFKNIENTTIYPLYKFILNEENKEKFKKEIQNLKTDDEFIEQVKNELIEKINETGYFEGIEYYINYITNETSSVLDFFDDYILIFNETSQIMSKYKNIDENYNQNYTD